MLLTYYSVLHSLLLTTADKAHPDMVEMQRRLGPLPLGVAQYSRFMARTPV